MQRKPKQLNGFNIFFGRYASWTVSNVLGDDRSAIDEVLARFLETGFLENYPDGYKPRNLIYYASPYTHNYAGKITEGVLGLVLAADDPADTPKNLMVLAVQVPLSPEIAQPGYYSNCHVTTEIYPADGHTLIPVSYEFARGTVPGKRLNYIVGNNGEFRMLPQSEGIVTGFKHIISAEYSRYGLCNLDFELAVGHRPARPGEAVAYDFYTSKEEFLSTLRKEVSGPLSMIEQELHADSGILAPADFDPSSFLHSIATSLSDIAYTDLVIYRQELDSRINPTLSKSRFGEDVQVPVEESWRNEESSRISHAIIHYPGALETILMLADRGQIDLSDPLLIDIIPEAKLLETLTSLGRVGLLGISGTTLWQTELCQTIVAKLRSYL